MLRPKARLLTMYRVGGFACDELDVARISRRTGWLSGEGLAVFVRGALERRGLDDVSIVHSRALLDVDLYGRAVTGGEGSVEACRAAIAAHVEQVCGEAKPRQTSHDRMQLVHPRTARKWLVLGHVKSPPHWTLLEIRWRERKILFYDSFSRAGGYAVTLESAVRAFLRICEELLEEQLDVDQLEWIPELVSVAVWSTAALTSRNAASGASDERMGLRAIRRGGRV